jgi:hypothetical protein
MMPSKITHSVAPDVQVSQKVTSESNDFTQGIEAARAARAAKYLLTNPGGVTYCTRSAKDCLQAVFSEPQRTKHIKQTIKNIIDNLSKESTLEKVAHYAPTALQVLNVAMSVYRDRNQIAHDFRNGNVVGVGLMAGKYMVTNVAYSVVSQVSVAVCAPLAAVITPAGSAACTIGSTLYAGSYVTKPIEYVHTSLYRWWYKIDSELDSTTIEDPTGKLKDAVAMFQEMSQNPALMADEQREIFSQFIKSLGNFGNAEGENNHLRQMCDGLAEVLMKETHTSDDVKLIQQFAVFLQDEMVPAIEARLA